jgi:hypothetical protein
MHSSATSTRSWASASARKTGWWAEGGIGRRARRPAARTSRRRRGARAAAARGARAARRSPGPEVLVDVDAGHADDI